MDRSCRQLSKCETQTILRKIQFPTIQELVKKIPPPGSTPIGSVTDMTKDDDAPSLVPNTSSDESCPYNHHTTTVAMSIHTEPSRRMALRKKSTRTIVKDCNSNFVKSAGSTLPESDDTQWKYTGRSTTPIARCYKPPSSTCCSRRSSLRTCFSSSSSAFSRDYLECAYDYDQCSNQSPPSLTSEQKKKATNYRQLHSVITELREKEVVFDRATAVQALKARILRGEKVSHDEIKALRHLTVPPHHRHLGLRLPWSKDLYCVKGLVQIPTPNKPPPTANSFGTMEDLRGIPTDDRITMEHWGRRQYVLNLAGFADEDISMYLEGTNRLVIRAVRPDMDGNENPPATITETILLPPDLPADNLRIVRKPSGTTIIEESWRF